MPQKHSLLQPQWLIDGRRRKRSKTPVLLRHLLAHPLEGMAEALQAKLILSELPLC